MKSLWKIYRRYYRLHRYVLWPAVVLMALARAEPYVWQGAMRYVVDDVLEIRVDGVPPDVIDEEDSRTAVHDNDGAEPPHDRSVIVAAPAGQPPSDATTARDKTIAVLYVALILVFARVIYVVCTSWSQFQTRVMNQKVVFRMRTHLFEKLQRLQLTYHDQRQTGRLVSRVIDDVRTIERTFASMAIMIASDVGSLLIGVAVVLSISPKLSLIAFTVLPFYALVYWRLQKPFDENAKGIRRINASIYGLAADRLSSPRVVKAFHQERRESIRFFQKNKKMLRMRHRQILLGRYMWSGSAVISVVGTVLVIGFGAQMVRTRILTVGDFLLFHAAIATFFGPITNIASLAGEVVWLRVIIDRIVEILDEPVTILDHPDAKAMTAIKGDIRFEHATLKYAEGPRPAVSNLTVHVPAGAKVCLMGASGAGKTSMASLLLRLYEPAEGRITIDEVPIEQIKLSDLRRHIAYVPQEPILFSGTIAQNIRYGRADARDDQLVNAAKAAEIHEFIDQTPAGYETMVGERGVLLSGGQKQRISLARALLTDPKILILDDSTSALDAHTEARIQRTLHFALADRTAIMITHRASLSSKADLILVMENGKIVETGRHEELLANGGVYWSLISDQLSEEQRADFDFHVDARR